MCACTPVPEELMEAVVSDACPRQALMPILRISRTFMFQLYIDQLSTQETENQAKLHVSWALYGSFCCQFQESVNRQYFFTMGSTLISNERKM